MNPALGRYARTLRHLRAGQLVARARLRGRRTVNTRLPGLGEALLRAEPVRGCWPSTFTPFDAQVTSDAVADDLRANRLTLLGRTRILRRTDSGSGAYIDWEHAEAPLLWRYHLHYWDWAWGLGRARDRAWGRGLFAELYLSWRAATRVGCGTAWSSYVVALRAWSLCGLWPQLAANGPAGSAVLDDLGMHRAFLRAHLETDVGGNHLLKNHKALVGLAVAAQDIPDLHRWVEALLTEVEHQVLADGGHYERAPAYHCQVLADLDDVTGLLRATGLSPPTPLIEATAAMRRWLAAILGPDGTVPLLNDGYPVSAAATRQLLAPQQAVAEPPRITDAAGTTTAVIGGRPSDHVGPRIELLADSGVAALRAGPWHLLADIGPPCPDELPAHAHADTLSFLLWLRGEPVLVDTGTSTYRPGAVRDAERSTAAHSTVMIDSLDSTEVWGAFRAGRRARPKLECAACDPERVELTASHDGYRMLPGHPTHRRTWRLDDAGLVLVDRLDGAGRHRIDVLFQFAPGTRLTPTGPDGPAHPMALRVKSAGDAEMVLHATGPGSWLLRDGCRAVRWGVTARAPTAVYVVDAELPARIRFEMTVHSAAQEALHVRPRTRPGASDNPLTRRTDLAPAGPPSTAAAAVPADPVPSLLRGRAEVPVAYSRPSGSAPHQAHP